MVPNDNGCKMENEKTEYPSMSCDLMELTLLLNYKTIYFTFMQRPIPDHYLKARYKAAVQPIYPNMLEGKPWYEVCGNVINPQKKEEVRLILFYY